MTDKESHMLKEIADAAMSGVRTASMRITLPDGRVASGSGDSQIGMRDRLMEELGVTELPTGTRIDVYRLA